MNQPPSSHLFPSGFPSDLASAGFVTPLRKRHGKICTSLPTQSSGSACMVMRFSEPSFGFRRMVQYRACLTSQGNVDRQGDEEWHSFVARVAAETLAYLRAFNPKFIEEGDIYVNVTWVSEAEFRNLKA